MDFKITEIGPDIFKLSTFWPEINLQFACFVVRDDEPVLYHTLMRGIFPHTRDAVSKLLPVGKLRWISFSHFEADESGALNEWLAAAPHAEPVCSEVGALVNINDFANRAARGLPPGETLTTGGHSFEYIHTPHLPHGWDAGVLFDRSSKTLFCSDLLHQNGDLEPATNTDVLGRVREALSFYQAHPLLANYVPYTANTGKLLSKLADLKPTTLATMHGSVFHGDGARVLRDLDIVMRETLVAPEVAQPASAKG